MWQIYKLRLKVSDRDENQIKMIYHKDVDYFLWFIYYVLVCFTKD